MSQPAPKPSRSSKSARAPRSRPKTTPPPNLRRKPPSTKTKALAFVLLGLGLGLAVIVGGYLALVRNFGNAKNPGRGAYVELSWPGEATPDEAARLLDEKGLVTSAPLFSLYLRITKSGGFRPGAHFLRDDLSPRELVRSLQRSTARPTTKVTFPEGSHRFDMAKRLEGAGVVSAKAFLEATTEPALLDELGVEGESAEGYLFPATYELFTNSEAREVVRKLAGEMNARYAKLEARHADAARELRDALGFGKREILNLASIVEKEAAVDEERPLVASVFLNRLRDKNFLPRQRLQSDATTAYGCIAKPELAPSCAGYAGRVTPDMNNDSANPYSTYRHSHLPPSPIANPGEKSIEAVLAPAKTRYFYFVARGGGRHAFSETLDQHREAIRASR